MNILATAEGSTDRHAWIDRARGLGIILVVLGHVISGLVNSGLAEQAPILRWTHFSIYLFHMPVFFFVAGLMIQSSLQKGKDQFLINKIWTVAYPYLLWSLLQSGLKMMAGDGVNNAPPHDLIGSILWDPFDHFWFLYVLMAYHLMSVLLGGRRMVMIGLAVVGLLFVWTVPYSEFAPENIVHKMARFYIFYAAGAFIGPYLFNATAPRLTHRLIWVIGLWAAFAVATAWAGTIATFEQRGLIAFPARLLGVVAFLLTVTLIGGRIGRALGWLGVASMTIFILHVIASGGVRIVLTKLNIYLSDPWDIAIGTFVGVAAPAIAYVVLKRLGWLQWLGLGPPPRAWIKAIATWTHEHRLFPARPQAH